MNIETFEREYAECCEWTISEFRERYKVVECFCHKDGCEGFAVVPLGRAQRVIDEQIRRAA